MRLNRNEYRDRVLGCWLGKNIGGTLGAPFEWHRQINDVSFYTQDLGGEPLPNDDLDIQLLWLVALEEQGVDIDAKTLGEYWLLYVTPHWAEYGTAKINLRAGLQPPLSGTVYNEFRHSCGAFIRSEIWACIAPGCPRTAARYAYEDAIIDHGNGEGMYAEVFCAALESAAFVEGDLRKLIEIGLSYIPADCGIAGAVRCAVEAYDTGKSWREARDLILEHYRGGTPFGARHLTSLEDQARGFAEGQLGWDAPSNIGMVVLGLLYGEGDFANSICTAVNCGEDTDCTAATIGAIFGILHGARAIPEQWITPIGRSIKTACLNLGELGYFGNQLPADVDALTDRTERITRQMILWHNLPVAIADAPTDLADLREEALLGDPLGALYENVNAVVFRNNFFEVAVDYGEHPFIAPDTPREVTIRLTNRYKTPETLHIRWYAGECWRISPARESSVHLKHSWRGGRQEVVFTVETSNVQAGANRLVVEVTAAGRPLTILAPVVLMGGNVAR